MIKLILSIALSASLTLSSSAQSQAKESLDVLSWNIYMLPGIANLSREIDKSAKKDRAAEIAEVINNSLYDVIVFQEAFFSPARRILSKSVKEKYPFQYGPINPSGLSLKTNSGIFVASKQALKVLGTIVYEACNGADCFAKKGAVLLEGTYDGKKYQILGTHLNAGGPHWIREAQYKQIRGLLDEHLKMDVPQIVCGDMNTHKGNAGFYKSMLTSLDLEDSETNSAQVFTTVKDRSVIDYILLRNNGTSLRTVKKEVLRINPNKLKVIHILNGNLSDHLALFASFTW
jgi:endonuclease/exonuclease/phosphatase family metal-dependent hydrolase